MAKLAKASKAVSTENNTVTWSFNDEAVEDFSVAISDLPAPMLARAALHGISQKYGDGYSGKMSPAAAREVVVKIHESIMKGEWAAPREAGEGRVNDLVAAVAEIQDLEEDVVTPVIEGLDKEQKAALRKDPKVAAKLAEIRLRRATEKAEAAEADEESESALAGLSFTEDESETEGDEA